MMTDPDNPERDPTVSAAWREHSAEMPPAELDAAILAAAHRAVGSVPQGSAPRAAGSQSPNATRPQRWWMPLAAAATIGAIALGILETVPQDQSVQTPSVSDMPAPLTGAASSVRDSLAQRERKDAPRAEAESMPQQGGSPSVPPPAAPTIQPATPPLNVPARPAGKILAQRNANSVAEPAPPPAAVPQPFPAEPKRDADEFGAASVGGTRKPATAPSAAPTSEFQRRKEAASDAPALDRSPPAAAAPAQERMAAASDDKRQRNEVAQSAPAAARAMFAKKAASAETDSAMSDSATRDAAKPVDVDAWIVRIRKLHDDGKLADAARELVALRAAIPDADRRLPPELRAWAATVKP